MFNLATNDAFRVVHVDKLHEAVKAVRSESAQALLISPNSVSEEPVGFLPRLVGRCPGVLTIGIVTSESSIHSLLELGAMGIEDIVDLRDVGQYARLRELVGSIEPVTARIIEAVRQELTGARPNCRRLFTLLVQKASVIGTSRELAAMLRISATTLNSRFFRTGLPSPKAYLSRVRLAYASGYFESQRTSIADVAFRLRYSSPQSFGRHVSASLGMTAGEFRRSLDFEAAIQSLRSKMFAPYASALQTFEPMG
jgi:AraC-like DNA-binding protein